MKTQTAFLLLVLIEILSEFDGKKCVVCHFVVSTYKKSSCSRDIFVLNYQWSKFTQLEIEILLTEFKIQKIYFYT